MEPLEREIQSLRNEIKSTDLQMLIGVFVISVLIFYTFNNAVITSKDELHELVYMLAITAACFIARQDYMLTRMARYIMYAQRIDPSVGDMVSAKTKVQSWEVWKGKRVVRKFVPFIDLLAGLALLWVLGKSGTVLWQHGHSHFVLGAGMILVAAICSIPLLVAVAGK